MQTTEESQRAYARVAIKLSVRFRVLESEDEAEQFGQSLIETPSVWGPPGESELWKLADSPSTGADGLVARALLALAAQIERLNRELLNADGPMEVGEIAELSCGGARFSTRLLLKNGQLLLLSLMGDDPDVPPVRCLAEVVHHEGRQDGQYGLAFKAIHPTDKERLTRFIYGLQRRELRRASRERS